MFSYDPASDLFTSHPLRPHDSVLSILPRSILRILINPQQTERINRQESRSAWCRAAIKWRLHVYVCVWYTCVYFWIQPFWGDDINLKWMLTISSMWRFFPSACLEVFFFFSRLCCFSLRNAPSSKFNNSCKKNKGNQQSSHNTTSLKVCQPLLMTTLYVKLFLKLGNRSRDIVFSASVSKKLAAQLVT